MNYLLFRNADGNTGYMSQHGNGGGSKSAHEIQVIILTCPLNCMHMEMVADIIESQGGIQGISVKRMYFHHKLGYTVK